MGEMADYYREQDEVEFYRSNKGFPGETYEEFCEREWQRKRDEDIEKAQKILEGMIRALQDGSYWIDKDQKRVRLNSISKNYARNLINWLEARATIFHDLVCLQMASGPQPRGDAASDSFDFEFNVLNEMDPKEWLNFQPLMIALRARAQRRLVRLKSLTEVQ